MRAPPLTIWRFDFDDRRRARRMIGRSRRSNRNLVFLVCDEIAQHESLAIGADLQTQKRETQNAATRLLVAAKSWRRPRSTSIGEC